MDNNNEIVSVGNGYGQYRNHIIERVVKALALATSMDFKIEQNLKVESVATQKLTLVIEGYVGIETVEVGDYEELPIVEGE